MKTTVNGNLLANSTLGFVFNKQPMIPVRPVIEALGGQVKWIGESAAIELQVGARKAILQAGNTLGTTDGRENTWSTAPRLIGERTVAPLGVFEGLGLQVTYDESQNSVSIKK